MVVFLAGSSPSRGAPSFPPTIWSHIDCIYLVNFLVYFLVVITTLVPPPGY